MNNHTKMYVTYTRIYGWSDYGGESSYQPGYRLENMMWMTLLVYDYIIPGEKIMLKTIDYKGKAMEIHVGNYNENPTCMSLRGTVRGLFGMKKGYLYHT